MATEKIFFAVEVDSGESVKDLEKLRGNLEGIKNEIKSVERARKRGSITAKEANKQTAALNVELTKSKKAYNDANKAAAGLEKQTGKLSKAFNGVAKGIAQAFAAASIIRAIGNTIDIIKDFEQASADVASVLGKTTDETIKLQNAAQNLGATTVFTATEVQELQKELAKLGFTEAQILSAQEAILQLAAATNTDLARAAEVAASTVKGFGLTAEDTQQVVDVMAKSFSSSALDMEKFATAMAIVAPVAKNAGFTIEETTAQLGILADRGIDASTAASALRNIFLDNAKAGRTFEEGLALINKSTDKTKTAFELFGKRGATVATVLAENSGQAGILTDALNNAGGAAQDMADTQLDTLNGQLKLLNSAWEGFILSLEKGDGVMGKLARGGIQALSSALTQLTNIGAITEVMFKGIEGASVDSRKAMLQNADALNVTLDSGMALSEFLEPFASKTLVELEEGLLANQTAFILAAQAQGQNAIESRLLFDAYLELRRETEKSIFTIEDETEAIGENTEAKNTTNDVERDLIKLKQAEIREAKNVVASSKPEVAARNSIVESLQKQLKALQDLRAEGEKEEGFTHKKLELLNSEQIAKDEAFNKDKERNEFEDALRIEEEDASLEHFEKEAELLNKEEEAKDAALEAERQRNIEQVEMASEFLASIQNLTNVFTDNKLRDLDKAAKDELAIINERERQGFLTRDEAEQARRKLDEDTDKRVEALERKAFKRNKAFNLASATIETALAVTRALSQPPGPPVTIPASVAAGAIGAIEVAAIASQKFAKGGIIQGDSHANGGVPIMGGRAEVEGGEIILTKGVAQNPSLLAAANSLNMMAGGQSLVGGRNNMQVGGIVSNNLPTFALPETSNNNDLNAIVDAIAELRVIVDVQEVTSAQSSIITAEAQATI